MDASRFDAWTRRRFGLLTGSLTASLLGVTSLADADAKKKKKKKKKKCKKQAFHCKPTGKKDRCCGGIPCEEFPGGFYCCHNIGESCQNGEGCCNGSFCNEDNVCQSLCPNCKPLNESCGVNCPCCSGLACVDGDCCFTEGVACSFSAQCCGTLTCQDETCAQCLEQGEACNDITECCGTGPPFLNCVGGFCVPQT